MTEEVERRSLGQQGAGGTDSRHRDRDVVAPLRSAPSTSGSPAPAWRKTSAATSSPNSTPGISG